MPVDPAPRYPSRSRPSIFADEGDAYISFFEETRVPQLNALEANVNTKEASTISAAAIASGAANTALAAVNATAWVSGTTYAIGQPVWSPVNLLTYRRKTNGAGTTDPSSDPTNWQLVGSGLTGDGTSSIGSRNRVINGDFSINQRSVSGTVTLSAGQYGHDRWKAGASGCTYTFSTTGTYTTLTITAGSLQQVIEGVNVNVTTYIMTWIGTAQGKIAGGLYGVSGVTTASAIAGSNMTIEFGAGTLSKVQVESGAVSTPFEMLRYSAKLALCQSYYIQYAGVYLGAARTASGLYSASPAFPVPMRISPSLQSGSSFTAYGGGANGTPALGGYSSRWIPQLYNSGTGWTVGNDITFTGGFTAEI